LYANGGSGAGIGKSQGNVMYNIGLGSYGDLFGAHISGAVYGLYTEGEDYGLYSQGDTYRTGADVHLQQDDSGQNNVMYTLVSPEMTIQTYGVGQLSNGKANIQFDAAFSNVVSDSEPIVITVTPIGESEGVHIEQVDGKGFRVAENRSGKSSVQFSWIAIGKRVGYENLSLPEDVISIDYDERINRGLSRDVDLNASGEGLYYQNGKLYTGKSPERISESVDVKTIERLNPVQIDEKNLEKLDKEPVKREAAKKETTEELKKDQ